MLSSVGVGPLSAEVASTFPHDYAVVDVETTGLSSADRLVQVAITHLDASGAVVDEWSSLLNPERHPGPVHVHGITPDRLASAPRFMDVADEIAKRLQGRILVAHNARFDHDMLAHEFDRLGLTSPSDRRLCTRNLARRLDLPLEDYRLSTVASYFGVPPWAVHDARADVGALVQVLRQLLSEAVTFGIELPLATCSASSATLGFRSLPSRRAPYVNPGPWQPGQHLVQGMAFVVTGATDHGRDALFELGYATGLSAMNGFTGRTSLVVCNDLGSGSRKLTGAIERGVPVVSEREFLDLLPSVLPGTRLDATAATQPRVPRQASGSQGGPLRDRRVIVLGGLHGQATNVRERIAELGGAPRVQFTQTITDIVALHGADHDKRWQRILSSGLTWLHPDTLEVMTSPADAVGAVLHATPDAADDWTTMVRGQVIDLPDDVAAWQIAVSWLPGTDATPHEVDVVAFRCDADEKVGTDDDFIFYNQPAAPDGAILLDAETIGEATLTVDLDCLDESDHQIVVAATLPDGQTFGDLGAVELRVSDTDGRTFARCTLDAATTEQSLHLLAVYRRRDSWRLRSVGQGYDFGLATLVGLHGVTVDD